MHNIKREGAREERRKIKTKQILNKEYQQSLKSERTRLYIYKAAQTNYLAVIKTEISKCSAVCNG